MPSHLWCPNGPLRLRDRQGKGKTLERLVLQFSIIDPLLDQFQFAYRNNRSVDNAVAIGLFYVLKHLDSPDTCARIIFVDFSSGFNTIIPSKLFDKIQSLGVPQSMCLWILEFLLNRPQVVKIGDNLSSSVTLSTGTPQGCVLSPMLYSLFTHDCLSCHVRTKILKFADDNQCYILFLHMIVYLVTYVLKY